MKIAPSIVLLLLGQLNFFSLTQARLTTPVLEESEIELGKKKQKQQGWHKPLRVSFQLGHFHSLEDIGTSEFNKKVAMGAFNKAFDEVFEGMSLDWGFIDSLVAIPEPEDPDRRMVHEEEAVTASRSAPRPAPRPAPAPVYNPYRRQPVPTPPKRKKQIHYYGTYAIDARCRLCPEDLLLGAKRQGGESFSNFMRDQAKWDEVAERFCQELKDTGIENFEEIDNCSFTVGYLGENEIELLESAPAALFSKEEIASGSIQTIITAHHIPASVDVPEDLLEKAFTVAYNNIFADRGYTVERVELFRQVTASEQAAVGRVYVQDDNKVALESSNAAVADDEFVTAMFWVKIHWTCTACHADDELPGVFLQNMPDTSRHSILESYVCHNLNEFGNHSEDDVTGCKIVFQTDASAGTMM